MKSKLFVYGFNESCDCFDCFDSCICCNCCNYCDYYNYYCRAADLENDLEGLAEENEVDFKFSKDAELDILNWQSTVNQTLSALKNKRAEAKWPRDTLLQYLQLMQKLQVHC